MRPNKINAATLATLCAVLLLCGSETAKSQIVNGNFEGGFYHNLANGWTLFSTSGYSPSAFDETSNIHGGSHAQKIVLPQPSSEGYGGIFQVIQTTPGQVYRIDFWIYASMPNEAYEGEDMQFHLGFDAQGRASYNHALVDFDISWLGIDTDRNVWKSAGREFQAAGTTATLFLRGWRKWPQHSTGYIIIDDVTVQPVSETHPPSVGTIAASPSPTLVGGNLLANSDFEDGFTNGVANSWNQWSTRGAGTFKPSTDLGKIGGGHYNPEDGAVGAFLSLSETAKVAFAMPPALNQLVTIKQTTPEVLTIGRHHEDNFNFWDKDDAGTVAEARAHAERCYAKHLEKPGIDAWQGYNEPWVQSRERARKVNLFAKAFAERCHELGIRSAVLNLGVGNPDNMQVAEFFKDALAVTDFVGYHSYGGAAEQFQTGPHQDDYSLRWREIKAHYDQLGWRHPAVVYTEAGTYAGWKGSYSPAYVRDKYIEFGPYMQADDWVVGEAIFTVGAYGYWDVWDIADDPLIIDGMRAWNVMNSADARGGKSQQWHHNGSNLRGGIVQAVGTNPGNYWLSGWFKYETGPGGDAVNPDIKFLIGYDSTGQTANGDAGTIVWSTDRIASRHLNAYTWYEFTNPVVATGSQVSIWFALDQATTSPTGRVYVDAIDLRATEGTVPPQPEIDLSPETLYPVTRVGADANDQTFTVRNTGGGVLAYTISADADWLSTVPGDGVCSSEVDTIAVHFDTSSLGVGTYIASITASDPNAIDSPKTLSVVLSVTVPGDFDNDGDVDQSDFGHLQSCFSGSGIVQGNSNCKDAMLDNDDDVDPDDFVILQGCMSGANVIADPQCAG